jgi:predicted HTH transcriptional regulator
MDVLSPPKACDPWAVRSAQTSLRGKNRLTVLTDRQKQIVQFVEENGEATAEEMTMAVGISQQELAREFATLRHMEILRGFRKEGKIYYILFERIV